MGMTPMPGMGAAPPPGLAQIPPAPQGGPSQGSMGVPSTESGQGAIPKLFFSVEQGLNTLAAALPGQSGEIGKIRDALREVLSKALQTTAKPGLPPSQLQGGGEPF